MAKYLIDANLPRYFHIWSDDEYEFVFDKNPAWIDGDVWNYAVAQGLTIVTKDADFSDRRLSTESGPRIIHIRTGNMRMRDFHSFLSVIWPETCQLSTSFQLVYVYRDRIECIE
ncbi:MAG: DUF5615 family PIN-like protein [Hyphomicrobiales bacterium]|nr:DUF5615 family PIN-like protein [Hyphomicrobiales bacterium]